MKVVLVGASGTLGKPIEALLREHGHEVIPATRHTQPGLNIDDPASIRAFFKSAGEVDAVVSAAGNAPMGALPTLTDEQLLTGINSKLLGQVNLVREGLASVRPGGVFVLTGGTLAYEPWPNTSPIALVNAGLEGFVRGAAVDMPDRRRILVVHPPFVRETVEQMGMDGAPYPPAAEVARVYLQALTGENTGEALFVEGYRPAQGAAASRPTR